MKKLILFIILFISHYQIFAQDLVMPMKSESFGLNHHTNRDISYFSHIDTKKNTIIVGTTEKDSTFTDIITTKLNENFDIVWQKRLSINTNLSYDIPVKSFINSNNELYIIGRSALRQSNANGLIFVVKYSEDGNIIFNKTIGNIDGSDYVDYGYMNADLNNDGTLSLVYSPFDYQTYEANNFKFLKRNNKGSIIDSFTLEIAQEGLVGEIKNEIFYFLIKELIDEVNYIYAYKFYKIQDENNVTILEINDSEFINYYNNSIISDQVKLTIDVNENCYLTCQNTSDNDTKDKINLSRIDNTNTLSYSINTSDTINYFLIGTFINDKNENIVIANNTDSNSIDFINIDKSNTLQVVTNLGNYLATGFKKNENNSFFMTTSNSNIRLFSNELIELKSFNTSNTFELIDFSKIDNQSIATIGTSYQKMFPESDYFTQLDIQSEKISDIGIVHDYSFSGVGTSKAFQQRVIIDNDNNYLVLVTEKMGPEYLGIDGANPPLNKRIIKYDPNLNKIWESEVPEHIFNLVNHGGREVNYFIDVNNNLYLNLPRAGDSFGLGYDLYKVSPSGNIEFINNSFLADKFFANEENIFLARNRFSDADSSIIYNLDKNTGNLIEEINLGSEILLDFFSTGINNFFYTYTKNSNNTPNVIFLYKNGVKIFTRNLPNNEGIYQYEIDDKGTLFFATQRGGDRRINKLDINNSYNFFYTASDISNFKIFNNGNIFLYLKNYNTLILDQNLNFISNGEAINSSGPYLI